MEIYLSIDGQIEKEMSCEELARATVETEKSHNLPPTSWEPRKATGVIESESKWKAWEPEELMMQIPVQGQGKNIRWDAPA